MTINKHGPLTFSLGSLWQLMGSLPIAMTRSRRSSIVYVVAQLVGQNHHNRR